MVPINQHFSRTYHRWQILRTRHSLSIMLNKGKDSLSFTCCFTCQPVFCLKKAIPCSNFVLFRQCFVIYLLMFIKCYWYSNRTRDGFPRTTDLFCSVSRRIYWVNPSNRSSKIWSASLIDGSGHRLQRLMHSHGQLYGVAVMEVGIQARFDKI